MTDRTCSIDGCPRAVVARGWCKKHWQRWSRGAPLEPQRQTMEQKFWSFVDTSGEGCWEWQGPITPSTGYGMLTFDYARISAHRFSASLAYGPIPAGALVCHHCDNRPCVRPSHLYVGTHLTNAADKVARGRQAHTGARFTAEQVVTFRARYRSGSLATVLARENHVALSSMWSLLTRQTYKHVE